MSREKTLRKLYNENDVIQVLGCIAQDTKLLSNKEYSIEQYDFLTGYHQIIFASVHNLVKQGATEIDDLKVGEYISTNFTSWLDIYKRNNLNNDFISNIKSEAKRQNFKFHYTRFKKLSLLRDLYKSGFDIGLLYDISEQNYELNKVFDGLTLKELFNTYLSYGMEIKSKWTGSASTSESYQPDEKMLDVYNNCKIDMGYGYPFPEDLSVLTQIFRGMRPGKFLIAGASSGTGKTRFSMAYALATACGYKYDGKKKQWVYTGEPQPTLYITTEVTIEEITTLMIAIIAGVEEWKILDNVLTEEEDIRAKKAIEILKRSKMYLEYIPDFTVESIESTVERHILQNNVGYVYFDYLHVSPSLLASLTKTGGGMKMREDQLVNLFASELKRIALQYEVFMYTSSQLNRNSSDTRVEQGANSMRSSFGLVDKADGALIMSKVKSEEIDKLKKKGLLNNNIPIVEPNICFSIFKNRGNRFTDMKIWLSVNKGDMSCNLVCCTDNDYELLDNFIINDFFGDIITGELENKVLNWLNDIA